MPALFAGIDGGQSSTVAVVLDERGVLLGRGSAGPSDHVDEPPATRRAAEACESALAGALAAARLPAGTALGAVVIGLSGYEGALVRARAGLRRRDRALRARCGDRAGRRDSRTAGGGRDRRDGSAAYGEIGDRDAGPGRRFRLPLRRRGQQLRDRPHGAGRRDAVEPIAACSPTSAPPPSRTSIAPTCAALARAVALREISRPQLAGFARVVFDAARLGDPEAAGDRRRRGGGAGRPGASWWSSGSAAPTSPAVPVAFVGGAIENAELRIGGRAPARVRDAARPASSRPASNRRSARRSWPSTPPALRPGPALNCARSSSGCAALIVSIQPAAESVLNTPETVALLARCAVANGAAGVRIEGGARIAAVRRAVDVPIVGLVKRALSGLRSVHHADRARDRGDRRGRCRDRRLRCDRAGAAGRLTTWRGWSRRSARRGALAMADCATAEELRPPPRPRARRSSRRRCAATRTQTRGVRPAGARPARRGARRPARSRSSKAASRRPTTCGAAFAAGAAAVVVGTAISNVDALVRRFAQAAPRRARIQTPLEVLSDCRRRGRAARARAGGLGKLGADQRRGDDLPGLAALPRCAGPGR